MLYGAECWPTKIRHVQQLSVAEMRMLRWICGHTRMDRIQNDDIRDRLGVAPIEEKLVQHRLRWFGHVQRRPPEALVHCGVLSQANNMRRGRGRPKLTWGEAIKRDLKAWDIPSGKQLLKCLNRDLGLLVGFNSSLPNLLGTERLCCCILSCDSCSVNYYMVTWSS